MYNTGGFLSLNGRDFIISKTLFNSSVASKGGAIYYEPIGSNTALNITNSVFFNCSTTFD